MTSRKFSPLRVKVTAVVLLIQFILLALVAFNMSRLWNNMAQQSIELRVGELNRLLSAALAPALASQDYASAFDLMEELRHEGQITYLVLYDRHRKPVVFSGWEADQPVPPTQQITHIDALNKTFHTETRLKLAEEEYGLLRYGISTQTFVDSMRGLFWQTLLIGLLGVCASTAFILLFGFLLTRHLYQLIDAAKALTEGKADTRITLQRPDEIGLLAAQFNNMAQALQERMQALHESERKFHALADYTHGCEMWLSPAGRLLWINRSVERLSGFTSDECLAMQDFPKPLLAPQDQQIVYDIFQQTQSGTSGQDVEFRALRKDGSEYWAALSWTPIYSPDKEYLGLRASVRDNTEYKETQTVLSQAVIELQHSQALQQRYLHQAEQEKARLSALLSAINVGILFVDNDNRVVYYNPAFVALWRVRHNNLIGNVFEQVMQQADNLPNMCILQPGETRTSPLSTHSKVCEYDMQDGRAIRQHSHEVCSEVGAHIGSVWLFEDVTENRRAAERLSYLAERDSLTGLFNRYRFQEELGRMLYDADRHKNSVGLLFFDLDEFKYINDTFGHGAGDTMLIRVAQEISSQIRRNEILCRLGGDEFALLVPDAKEAEMTILAERLVRAIEQITFAYDGQSLRMATSVGVALFPQHAENGEELVANADMAMYQAKASGKNTWRLYRSDQNIALEIVSRWSWKERIQNALDRSQFQLHFQGIFHAESRRLSHLEVLVRMHDEQDPAKLIMPGQFIPVAEKTGKIIEIDRWIIRESVKLLSASPLLPPLSINISGRSFDHPELPAYIAEMLLQYHVAPSRLYVEVTETAAVSDMRDAQRFIDLLRATGCRVCLDDFGTGFSSFAYLKHLKAEVLKIDGMFVRDLVKDQDSQIFVKGMVNMAHSMGKLTVAEFVENQETLDMLVSFGIDMVQGFYLDKPRADHPALTGQFTLEGF